MINENVMPALRSFKATHVPESVRIETQDRVPTHIPWPPPEDVSRRQTVHALTSSSPSSTHGLSQEATRHLATLVLTCTNKLSQMTKIRLNSLAPRIFKWNLMQELKVILVFDGWAAEVILVKLRFGDCHWTSLMTIDKSILVQVIWSHHETHHYLNQSWPWLLLPYRVTRPH